MVLSPFVPGCAVRFDYKTRKAKGNKRHSNCRTAPIRSYLLPPIMQTRSATRKDAQLRSISQTPLLSPTPTLAQRSSPSNYSTPVAQAGTFYSSSVLATPRPKGRTSMSTDHTSDDPRGAGAHGVRARRLDFSVHGAEQQQNRDENVPPSMLLSPFQFSSKNTTALQAKA